jgi:hypothetical protein
MQRSMSIHSSQEALALAVRDWLLNSGQLVKLDVMRIANMIHLVAPMQKKSGDKLSDIISDFSEAASDFNPMYDQSGYLNKPELNYEIALCMLFGRLWCIMHEEELIPPGLLTHRVEKWE